MAAVGGRSATATITPTSAEERPVTSESAAAAPEASAMAMPSKPTCVRDISSFDEASTGQTAPISRLSPSATAMPAALVVMARAMSLPSPSATPTASARLGPRSGAITMAPTTTATLSAIMPKAATTVERTTKTM